MLRRRKLDVQCQLPEADACRGVIERRGALSVMPMASAREACMENLVQVRVILRFQGATEPIEPPDRGRAVARHFAVPLRSVQHRLQALVPESERGALVVVSLPAERLAEEERCFGESADQDVRIIDRTAHEALLGLVKAGLIAMPTE